MFVLRLKYQVYISRKPEEALGSSYTRVGQRSFLNQTRLYVISCHEKSMKKKLEIVVFVFQLVKIVAEEIVKVFRLTRAQIRELTAGGFLRQGCPSPLC